MNKKVINYYLYLFCFLMYIIDISALINYSLVKTYKYINKYNVN